MFALKSPLTLPLPRRADRTRLPAALAGGLVLLVGIQLALPADVELPDAGVVPRLRLRPVEVPAVVSDPVILGRALFAPGRRNDPLAAGPDSTAALPLGGALAVGVVRSRAGVRVFLQAPDGKVVAVSPGGGYQGWQLVRIAPDAVTFARGPTTHRLLLSASQTPLPRATEPAEPEEDQP